MEKISSYIMLLVVFTNLALIYSIHQLPDKLNQGNRIPIKDEKKDKVVTATLEGKSDFFYFEGKVISDGLSISEDYKFNPNYPNEIWGGYLNLAQDDDGAKYFIWSKTKIQKENIPTIKGWFLSYHATFQDKGKEYYQVIFPIVERQTKAEIK